MPPYPYSIGYSDSTGTIAVSASSITVTALAAWTGLPVASPLHSYTLGAPRAPLGEEEREAAGLRARELLLAHLDEEQREELEEYHRFHVDVRGKRYLITRKRSENVYRIENGRRCERYCIHQADHQVPLEDVMLAQKLMLEAEEEEFLRIANRWPMAA